jgi:hypothetical protein
MTCPDPGSENQCPRYQAADPTLQVLEVVRNGVRTGLRVFYAIHNTAMSHSCALYQSDLAGYAMHQLEAGAPDGEPVVAGFFNGAEGDVSPRRRSRTDGAALGTQSAGNHGGFFQRNRGHEVRGTVQPGRVGGRAGRRYQRPRHRDDA